MTIKLTTLLTACLLLTGTATMAQETKTALVTTPEPEATEATQPEAPAAAETYKAPALPRLHYSMEMGAMAASGRYGYTATYLRPTAYYNINSKFRAFTSLTYLNVNGMGSFSERGGGHSFNSQHYLLEAGGQYLHSDNLLLTGSVWKDFSQTATPGGNPYAPGRQGMSFRADYKVSDRVTITGGIRYSQGHHPGNHNNFFSQPYSPAGF